MTPKEKAEELFDIYKKQVSMIVKDYNLVCKVLDVDMAKQCALIAVEQIEKSHNDLTDFFRESDDYIYFENYWQEVKQEIQAL